jgi:hypothetical protein
MSSSSTGTVLRRICRAYREAATAYDRAFRRGDVEAIEDAFSRMQEIACAFDQGVEWARHEFAKGSPSAMRAQ